MAGGRRIDDDQLVFRTHNNLGEGDEETVSSRGRETAVPLQQRTVLSIKPWGLAGECLIAVAARLGDWINPADAQSGTVTGNVSATCAAGSVVVRRTGRPRSASATATRRRWSSCRPHPCP